MVVRFVGKASDAAVSARGNWGTDGTYHTGRELPVQLGKPGDSRPVFIAAKPLEYFRDVLFLPLTWTVVHPIDSESPLSGKTAEDIERLRAEVLILIKGRDDTFNQTVTARHSYRHNEMVWGARFAPAFSVDPEGDLVLELRKVGELRRELVQSTDALPNDEIEAGGFGERAEVPVSRKKRNPAINTALSDQCIAEARLTALCQYLRS